MDTNVSGSDTGRGRVPQQRDEGDGSAAPVIRAREAQREGAQCSTEKPFSVRTEIDLMQCVLFAAGLLTRMGRLNTPNSVNFDEMHFGRYAGMYLRGTFYFDIHPPLGKLLFALSAWYGGFDPQFKFDKIGAEYPASVSAWHLRLFPALLSSLTVPIIYELMVELRAARWTAALAASLFILDNSLIVHARCTVMEGMIVFFIFLALLSLLKLRNLTKSGGAFGLRWWTWLTLMGLGVGCAPSIKYSGFLGVTLLAVLDLKDLWNMLDCASYSNMFLVKYVCSRFVFLVALPAGIYMGSFYAHLTLLTKAGPNDDIMTSAFQASLEGGLAAITKGQPLEVAYGSRITLRRTYGAQPCWLHSHNSTYPLRYPDKRGSSYQQQVTCYNFKDVNNWWIIKHPEKNHTFMDNPPQVVRHGDVIELLHGMTSRLLNSHNVAAPLSPASQEVSCFMDWKVNATLNSLWRVFIANKESRGDSWQTIKSEVKFLHINTSQMLRTTGKVLPEWGFYQNEVATDKDQSLNSGIFNVEEHRYSPVWQPVPSNATEEDQKKELMKAELLPIKPVDMSFWAKFIELQLKMLTSKHDADLEHKYSSGPHEWPLFDRNVAYWLSSNSNAQIHLVGNLLVWYTGFVAVIVFSVVMLFHLMRRARAMHDISQARWEQLVIGAECLLAGYLLHYVPYLSADRTMFVYSYIPALCFQILLTAFLVEHVHALMWSPALRSVFLMLVVVWFTAVVNVFLTFLPITYGFTSLTFQELQQLKWKPTWDFLWSSKHE